MITIVPTNERTIAHNKTMGPRKPGLESPANWGPNKDKQIQKKSLSINDDVGKLSKFLEIKKKTVEILKNNWLYS